MAARKKAHAKWVPDRGDIVWIEFSPQVGQEMKNLHPMLVLSTKPFNDRTSLVIGLPMTTSATNTNNPFAVRFAGPDGTESYVLTHQPKSLDWRRRAARPHAWKSASPWCSLNAAKCSTRLSPSANESHRHPERHRSGAPWEQIYEGPIGIERTAVQREQLFFQ